MWRYVLKRLFALLIVIFCVSIIIFCVLWFMPGDPAEIILGMTVDEADREALREKMGWNDPFLVQLGNYLKGVFFHLDFGDSYQYKVPVTQGFLERLPRTLKLGLISVFIQSVIGIPLGVSAAIHRNTLQDQGLLVFAMVFISVPQFWFALMMVVLFSVKLGWLPPYDIGSWKHWVLPIIANSISGIAMNARQTRSAVLETIRADFVTTARAKGLPEGKVIYKHMLPNALIPVVNGLGMQLGMCVGGTVVIENVFSFPGVGNYMITGINGLDYPVVRGCVLILATVSAVMTLVVDLTYAFLDPRIKAQYVNYAAKKGAKKA